MSDTPPETAPEPEPTPAVADDDSGVLANSAVMAAGTVVSRLSGYVRSILLAAALGNLIHADVFTIANTVPNMLYILLAGGIFNAVLVPQLVRAATHDADQGDAYTNRVITLAALFLGTITVLLVISAPWLMQLFVDPDWRPDAAGVRRRPGPPTACRRSSSTGCTSWSARSSTPAAGSGR